MSPRTFPLPRPYARGEVCPRTARGDGLVCSDRSVYVSQHDASRSGHETRTLAIVVPLILAPVRLSRLLSSFSPHHRSAPASATHMFEAVFSR